MPTIEPSAKMEKPLAAGEERQILVDLEIERAGVYEITAHGPGGSSCQTQVTWVRGVRPEDDVGPVPFFGTNSHARNVEWGFPLRREFGSRLERGMVHWHGLTSLDELRRQEVEEQSLKSIFESSGVCGYGMTCYTPAYASPRPEGEKHIHDMPIIKHYVDWVEAAARYYRPTIRYWEIWNEPNGDGHFFRGSAEDLSDLHKAAFLAVKRVDPYLKIVGASTVGIDLDFMDRLADAGALDYMDVIAFHNYCWAYPPDPVAIGHLKRVITWRDRYAPGRPLWDNEWGPARKPTDDPSRHANLVARQLIITKALGVQHTDYYTWGGDRYRYLFRQKWPTPSAIAYRTVAQRLTNAVPVAAISESGNDQGVHAYVFGRRDLLTLAAWTVTHEAKTALPNVPIVKEKAALYDLMGNPVPLSMAKDRVDVPLGTAPIFLEGVSEEYLADARPLLPSPNDPPPRTHPSLWYSFHYPKGSEVVSLPRGETRRLELTIHNDGDEPASGKLFIAGGKSLAVQPNTIEVTVPPKSEQTVPFDVFASKEIEKGIHRVNIRGQAGKFSFGTMTIRCYVSDHDVVLFHMATWEMAQHLVDAKDYGQGHHLRWIDPGGCLKLKFDLMGAKSATLSGYMDSISPAPADGGNFRISASLDDHHWDILLDERGPLAWREVDLTPYAGHGVFVLLENPTDKGQCRIRQCLLRTRP